jgi:hypothetical protein
MEEWVCEFCGHSPVVVLFMQAFQVKNPKSSIALWGVPRYIWPVWVSCSCSFRDFFPQLSGTGSHPPVPLFVLASSTFRYPFGAFHKWDRQSSAGSVVCCASSLSHTFSGRLYQIRTGIKLIWYQLVLVSSLFKKRYPPGTNFGYLKRFRYQSCACVRLNTDYGQVYGRYIDWYETGIT